MHLCAPKPYCLNRRQYYYILYIIYLPPVRGRLGIGHLFWTDCNTVDTFRRNTIQWFSPLSTEIRTTGKGQLSVLQYFDLFLPICYYRSSWESVTQKKTSQLPMKSYKIRNHINCDIYLTFDFNAWHIHLLPSVCSGNDTHCSNNLGL